MDHRSPTAEASLLFSATQLPDLTVFEQDAAELLEDYGEIVHSFEKVNDTFFLLKTDTLQILLAFANEALPLDGFLDAERPGAASTPDREMLNRLIQVASTITVIVLPQSMDVDHSATGIVKFLRHICWDIVDCLNGLGKADLIYWADEGMLFSHEEFERAGLIRDGVIPDIELVPMANDLIEMDLPVPADVVSAPEPKAVFATEPLISAEARAWFEGTHDCRRGLGAEDDDISVLDSIAAMLPVQVARHIDPEERRLTMQRFSMAATTATVSLSSTTKVANIFL